MVQVRRFYCYIHLKEDGTVVYVGKGQNERYLSKSKDRSSEHLKIWDSLIKKIYRDKLTRDEAARLETELYDKYVQSGDLLNKVRPSLTKKLDYDTLKSFVKISPEFPTGLAWVSSGKMAGYYNNNGYYQVGINCQRYLCHRVVVVLRDRKDIPEGMVVDHIDGDKRNNSPNNLSIITSQQNNQKAKGNKNSKSGAKGVSWQAADRCWRVCWRVDGMRKFKFFTPSKLYPNICENEAILLSFDDAVKYRETVTSEYHRGLVTS